MVDAFPLLPSGKVDRKTLALQTSARPVGDRGHVAPQTPTQERLAAIWRNLLKVGEFSITDNFFELGGHSLMVMQVVARIRKEFEVEVPIRSLFDDPTIQGLAIEVEEAKAKGIKAFAPFSSFLHAQNNHRRSSLSVEHLSREELEEMLRQVLREKSVGSST
jgi:acyl carrier protein